MGIVEAYGPPWDSGWVGKEGRPGRRWWLGEDGAVKGIGHLHPVKAGVVRVG